MTTIAENIVPMGASDFNEAPAMTTMSVSLPTPAVYGDTSGTGGVSYWSFTADQTGLLSFDAMLSHYMDPKVDADFPYGPLVTLSLFKKQPGGDLSWLTGTSYYGGSAEFPPRNQGRFQYEVEAGTTYVLSTQTSNTFPWIATVVRIGDYPPPGVWQQPADIEHVFSRTGANHSRTLHPLTNPAYGGDFNGGFPSFYLSRGFQGDDEANRSLGGPDPWTMPGTVQCVWNWARRVYIGTSGFWSGGNVEWEKGGDPNYCPIRDNVEYFSEHSFSDMAIGYSYDVYTGAPMLPSSIQIRTYAISFVCLPRDLEVLAMYTGTGATSGAGALPPDVTIPSGATIIWENTDGCELISYEVAPDQSAVPTGPAAAITAKWYMSPNKTSAEMAGAWGPRQAEYGTPNDLKSATYSRWVGTLAGPESWVGTQTHLGDYSGGTSSWTPIPQNLWDLPYGIRFSCLPDGLLSSTPPAGLASSGSADWWALRSWQFCAVRAVVRPSRYMLILPAEIPDITYRYEPAIEMELDDDGRVLY